MPSLLRTASAHVLTTDDGNGRCVASSVRLSCACSHEAACPKRCWAILWAITQHSAAGPIRLLPLQLDEVVAEVDAVKLD